MLHIWHILPKYLSRAGFVLCNLLQQKIMGITPAYGTKTNQPAATNDEDKLRT